MKEDKYAKSLAKNQVYKVVHMPAKYSVKGFTQIYKCHVCVPFKGTNMAAGNQQKHLFLSFPTYA